MLLPAKKYPPTLPLFLHDDCNANINVLRYISANTPEGKFFFFERVIYEYFILNFLLFDDMHFNGWCVTLAKEFKCLDRGNL